MIGQLIDKLRDAGAEVIALDVVFAERDRYDGKDIAPDDALAVSLRKGRVVLGYAMTFDGTHHAPRTCVQHPLGLAVIHPSYDQSGDPFFRATGAVCNLESLSEAAGASGFLNAAPDPDGILRRVPMLVEFDGRVFPALSLAAVTNFTGARPVAVRVSNVNSSTLVLGGNNTFTGGIALQGGTLSVGSDANLGGAGTVAMSNGTTLNFTSGGTYAHALTVAGTSSLNAASGQSLIWSGVVGNGASAGALQLTGGGIFTLTNTANSYSGGTIVSGGSTLNFNGDATLGAAAAGITLGDATTSGTLAFGASATSSRAITLGAGGGTVTAASGTTATFNGLIGGAGAFQLMGGGIFALTNAANSYSGGTVVTGNSTLNVSGDGALGDTSGALTLGDASTGATLGVGASSSFGRGVNLGAGGGTITAASGTTATFNGAIGGAGALQLTGGGIFALSNAGNSYAGGTIVTGNSTLNVGSDGALGAAGGALTLGDATTGGVLGVTASSSFARTVGLGAGGGTITAASGTTAIFNGTITGAGTLQLTGGGIFAESQKLGLEGDWRESGVFGCDSVQNAVHRGKMFWAWGDTTMPHYPLGIFDMSSATTPLALVHHARSCTPTAAVAPWPLGELRKSPKQRPRL